MVKDIENELIKIQSYLGDNGFLTTTFIKTPKREARYENIASIENISKQTIQFFSGFKGNVYGHQKLALEKHLKGENICLATSTGSGKSEVFIAATIEKIVKNPEAKVLLIYPIKALATQQQKRFEKALIDAGITDIIVSKIDGDIPLDQRKEICKDSHIISVTPDVLHAWFLNNLSESYIKQFFKKVELIIVDEVHSYTGILGSNSAYLFRRILHIIHALSGKTPLFITASGTIKNPIEHLKKLIGLDFEIIGEKEDSSPKNSLNILMEEFPAGKSKFQSFIDLITFVASHTELRSISFVDSRKQAEQSIAAIKRANTSEKEILEQEEKELENEEQMEPEKLQKDKINYLQEQQILPYRSGYEKDDSQRIQELFSSGALKGIISTSALEMGMDIKGLDICILYGVPPHGTSFFQRIGRVGRHNDGIVIILNDESLHSETAFQMKENILTDLPVVESSLYLENKYLQYIHVLCFASNSEIQGEYFKLNPEDTEKIVSIVDFPESFLKLCNDELTGQIPADLITYKQQIEYGSPHRTYPMRDLEKQFNVQQKSQMGNFSKGSISFSQVLREAYPGAVYYYMGRPYRVYKVNPRGNEILVKMEKNYFTSPLNFPKRIEPNFLEGSVVSAESFGQLSIIETEIQIGEGLYGYSEKKGKANPVAVKYPDENGYWKSGYFSRYFSTTGVMFFHPLMNEIKASEGEESKIEENLEGIDNVGINLKLQLETIAELFYEVFLTIQPYEKQDINFGFAKLKLPAYGLKQDDKFFCIYDGTYGSLKLSHAVNQQEMLIDVVSKTLRLVEEKSESVLIQKLNSIDIFFLQTILADLRDNSPKNISQSADGIIMLIEKQTLGFYEETKSQVKIIDVTFLPGKGLHYKCRIKDRQGAFSIVKNIPIDQVKGSNNYVPFDVEQMLYVEEE